MRHIASSVAVHLSASRRQLLIVGYTAPGPAPENKMPSFHDPRNALHRHRARLAQLVLKAVQRLGVVVYVGAPTKPVRLAFGSLYIK